MSKTKPALKQSVNNEEVNHSATELPPTAVDKYLPKEFLGSSHSWADERLRTFHTDAEILDFAAGSGIMGKKLQKLGFTKTYAVDIDPASLEQIKDIYTETADSYENLSTQKFDLILLLDIIEHLTRPDELFQELASLLKPGGRILISVPNIAHWSIRLSLLFGLFEYTDRGILDRTHYNHFTKKRILNFFDPSQFGLIEYAASTSPVQFVLPKAIWDNEIFNLADQLRLKIANLFPGLLAYQHMLDIKLK